MKSDKNPYARISRALRKLCNILYWTLIAAVIAILCTAATMSGLWPTVLIAFGAVVVLAILTLIAERLWGVFTDWWERKQREWDRDNC